MATDSPAFLLDMDGVIYRDDHLLPGAAELIDLFHEREIPFLFLTNNSIPTPDDLAVKLGHLGVAGLTPAHFYTSALNTADFLAETHPGCTVFALGEAGLFTALNAAGIANDGIAPDYVIAGEGLVSMEKVTKAHELVEKGARLVATNPDCWCPAGGEKTRPGAGALAAYLQTSTGSRPYYLGKPNPYMFSRARKRLALEHGMSPDRPVVMVGDTMETDIRGAVEVGLEAYLVLTGSTALGELADYVYQPTRVLEGVAALAAELRTGAPAEGPANPAVAGEKHAGSRKKRYATM